MCIRDRCHSDLEVTVPESLFLLFRWITGYHDRMSNPYTAAEYRDTKPAQVPVWYILFCRLCQPMWWIGTALIACSWFGIVTTPIGWIGFGLAIASSLGAAVLPSIAGVKQDAMWYSIRGCCVHGIVLITMC